MNTDKIKAHFEQHKIKYAFVGGAIFAGITSIIMRERHAVLHKGADGSAGTTMRSFNFFANKPSNVVTTIHNGGRGHSGFRVHNFEHDINFDTQGAAARAFGIPENVMSLHLNNRIPNAQGYHFERIAA